VHRLIDEGVSPVEAAIQSGRALASPIIAMTVVLIAVYVPVGFQGGLTGALFTEFAFTLAGAVTVSAVIALTLSPMNCAWLLRRTERGSTTLEARLVRAIDHVLERLAHAYRRCLESVFSTKPVVVVFAFLLLAMIPWLYVSSTSELAPDEDQGVVLTLTNSAPSATLEQRQFYAQQLHDLIADRPETRTVFQIDASTQVIGGWVLKPWDQRKATTKTLQPEFQQMLNGIAGARSVAFQPSPLPGSNGLPIQFVIGSTGTFNQLNDVSRDLMNKALASGKFIFLDSDLKIDKPQTTVVFDRDKAADLGLKMSDLGGALATMLGGNYLDYFSLEGRSYKVIPQVRQNDRLTDAQLLDYSIRAGSSTMVPLATVAHLEHKTIPESLNHFQQINAATISGVAMPGVSMGDALATLKELGKSLPSGYSIDYGGASRQRGLVHGGDGSGISHHHDQGYHEDYQRTPCVRLDAVVVRPPMRDLALFQSL
ncbi:MAG: efflux RND transporter permease subunit, partial [Bradyrhizobium sp.]|nr:efflux RND transporter permease subunit [Bradyrhizobium sp.]